MIEFVMAVFPALSALFILLNLRAAIIDKDVKGVSLKSLGFFTTYAVWMVFYFHHHDETYPMWTAVANAGANLLYVLAAIYYTRRRL